MNEQIMTDEQIKKALEIHCNDKYDNCEGCSIDYDGEHCVHLQMKRPPQSWCYAEEV